MYGRNFYFLATPKGAQRQGRYFLDESVNRPIGVPVTLSGDEDAVGRLGVELAVAANASDKLKPAPGTGGILVYEHIQFRDVDPWTVTYSDFDYAPAGAAVQVVKGPDVKVGLVNTTADTFLTRTGYPAPRVMVAGVAATSTVEVGEYLTPGVGNDDDGYWAVTTDADEAWLVVTQVDGSTGLCEAILNF